ncbi:MAG: DUF4058 family protein [Candidatus Saccharimonas sp.]|nr:DUF4058 family protein [Planctomycetaceae bacterium]
MPNPFPGMDPYLEGPAWPVVHSHLVAEIARQLSAKLDPKYVAWTNERVVVGTPDPIELPSIRGRYPDVSVLTAESGVVAVESGTASAVIVLEALMPEPMVQTYVEVREVESQKLVTAIEMLSPTNKRGDGLAEFRKKRIEYLSGPAHYMEIDLLRSGERFPTSRTMPSVPYFVFLSRAGCRPRLDAWPIALDQKLPTVNISLLPGDDDVLLDLQLAWHSVYSLFRFHILIDHLIPPVVPLSPEQSTWAHDRLMEAGMVK